MLPPWADGRSLVGGEQVGREFGSGWMSLWVIQLWVIPEDLPGRTLEIEVWGLRSKTRM